MARGKHGASAAARRSQTEYEATIADLEKKLRGLEGDYLELVNEAARTRRAHAAETARLHKQIEDGSSDEVAALHGLIEELRTSLGDMRGRIRRNHEAWLIWQKNAHKYAVDVLGMTIAGAVKWVHELGEVPFDESISSIAEHGTRGEVVQAIRERAKKRA